MINELLMKLWVDQIKKWSSGEWTEITPYLWRLSIGGRVNEESINPERGELRDPSKTSTVHVVSPPQKSA